LIYAVFRENYCGFHQIIVVFIPVNVCFETPYAIFTPENSKMWCFSKVFYRIFHGKNPIFPAPKNGPVQNQTNPLDLPLKKLRKPVDIIFQGAIGTSQVIDLSNRMDHRGMVAATELSADLRQ